MKKKRDEIKAQELNERIRRNKLHIEECAIVTESGVKVMNIVDNYRVYIEMLLLEHGYANVDVDMVAAVFKVAIAQEIYSPDGRVGVLLDKVAMMYIEEVLKNTSGKSDYCTTELEKSDLIVSHLCTYSILIRNDFSKSGFYIINPTFADLAVSMIIRGLDCLFV